MTKINLKKILPKKTVRLIQMIDKLAGKNSYKVFLVGGPVRDILLRVKTIDLDIVVEGDAVGLVKDVVKVAGGSFVVHGRFGTATAVLPSGVKVDFATARRETYERPAALPTVEFSSLEEDLSRRDFTINAMALSINSDDPGHLVDLFGGKEDLSGRKIRVLHDKSFIDDPTRILRAIRFEQRLDFTIEPHTEKLIKEAVAKRMLDNISRQRIRNELILILKETASFKALKRLEGLCGLAFIHPRLRLSEKKRKGV